MLKYHVQRLQNSVPSRNLQDIPSLPGSCSRGHVEKQWKISDFRQFWQKSRLSGAAYPRRDGKNRLGLGFGTFIGITLAIFFPVTIENIFRRAKLFQKNEKFEFSSKSGQSETPFTNEIQWVKIENFKTVNFESHGGFFLQK